eukprot:2788107-Rhodomonas_salina.1
MDREVSTQDSENDQDHWSNSAPLPFASFLSPLLSLSCLPPLLPDTLTQLISTVQAGAAVFTVLFALMRFKWLSGLLSGLVVAAVTTFSIAATILPLLPVILPVAAGFLIVSFITLVLRSFSFCP